jgi:acetate kinase
LGLSGTSGDVRDLSKMAAAGDARAKLALQVFVRAVRHYLGAFLAALGGADVITFSGGIGENSREVRAAVCAGLEELGIVLDGRRNAAASGEGPISAEASKTAILIVPADEERIVARATAELLAGKVSA